VHRQRDGLYYVGVAPHTGRTSGTQLWQVADLAEQYVGVRAAVQPVVPRAPVEVVAPRGAAHDVVAGAAVQPVVPRAAVLLVRPARSRQPVGARIAEEPVVRRAAEEQVVPVVAAALPEPRWELLDRYLAATESRDLPALILVTNLDLVSRTILSEAVDEYERIGYRRVCESADHAFTS